MGDSADELDHYEVLQLSPRADHDTIHRVFRHLAKRLHPDNTESGDSERFARVMQAFEVLSDPAARAQYDVRYEAQQQSRWRIFDQQTTEGDIAGDRRVRTAILSLLYTARRNDAERPGVGVLDLERVLGCPEQHMNFHIWYLKENGWLERQENGTLAITASGVDRILDLGGPARDATNLLSAGNNNGNGGSHPA
jgi:curved DNA-binding protein CbpA